MFFDAFALEQANSFAEEATSEKNNKNFRFLQIHTFIYYTSVLLLIPSTRSDVAKKFSCNRKLFCNFNWCFVATGSCFVTSIVALLEFT